MLFWQELFVSGKSGSIWFHLLNDPINLDPINLDPINLDPIILDPINLNPINLDPIKPRQLNISIYIRRRLMRSLWARPYLIPISEW